MLEGVVYLFEERSTNLDGVIEGIEREVRRSFVEIWDLMK